MDLERELLKGNTPTLILAVLREGPLHGYAIAREIDQRSGSVLRCKEGTLYPVLHALERDGLIAGEWRREEGGRERKVYVITETGATALEERSRMWTRFSGAVERVLGAGEEEPDRSGSPPLGLRPKPAL